MSRPGYEKYLNKFVDASISPKLVEKIKDFYAIPLYTKLFGDFNKYVLNVGELEFFVSRFDKEDVEFYGGDLSDVSKYLKDHKNEFKIVASNYESGRKMLWNSVINKNYSYGVSVLNKSPLGRNEFRSNDLKLLKKLIEELFIKKYKFSSEDFQTEGFIFE